MVSSEAGHNYGLWEGRRDPACSPIPTFMTSRGSDSRCIVILTSGVKHLAANRCDARYAGSRVEVIDSQRGASNARSKARHQTVRPPARANFTAVAEELFQITKRQLGMELA